MVHGRGTCGHLVVDGALGLDGTVTVAPASREHGPNYGTGGAQSAALFYRKRKNTVVPSRARIAAAVQCLLAGARNLKLPAEAVAGLAARKGNPLGSG